MDVDWQRVRYEATRGAAVGLVAVSFAALVVDDRHFHIHEEPGSAVSLVSQLPITAGTASQMGPRVF